MILTAESRANYLFNLFSDGVPSDKRHIEAELRSSVALSETAEELEKWLYVVQGVTFANVSKAAYDARMVLYECFQEGDWKYNVVMDNRKAN